MNCNQNCVRPMENKEPTMAREWPMVRKARQRETESHTRKVWRDRGDDERRTRSIDVG